MTPQIRGPPTFAFAYSSPLMRILVASFAMKRTFFGPFSPLFIVQRKEFRPFSSSACHPFSPHSLISPLPMFLSLVTRPVVAPQRVDLHPLPYSFFPVRYPDPELLPLKVGTIWAQHPPFLLSCPPFPATVQLSPSFHRWSIGSFFSIVSLCYPCPVVPKERQEILVSLLFPHYVVCTRDFPPLQIRG